MISSLSCTPPVCSSDFTQAGIPPVQPRGVGQRSKRLHLEPSLLHPKDPEQISPLLVGDAATRFVPTESVPLSFRAPAEGLDHEFAIDRECSEAERLLLG